MRVFVYAFNVVPNFFRLHTQKLSADAQKALGAEGYWSRQIINSKPISIQSKDNCIDECIELLRAIVAHLKAGLLYDFLGLGRQHPKVSRQCVNTTLDCCMTLYER